MNISKTLQNVKYVYDDDLWFFPQEQQLEVLCHWVSKINEHNKLFYINPQIHFKKA